MKLFNVMLSVSFSEIGDAEESTKPKPGALADAIDKDSPLKDAAKLVDLLLERGLFPGASPMFPAGTPMRGEGEGLSMHHQFKVIVGSFAEMQEMAANFRAVADKLTLPATE
jgi:hypothetical protein